MVSETGCVADAELLSVALTVKFAVPAAVGVPLSWPPALKESPAGGEPETTDQLYGGFPPLA